MPSRPFKVLTFNVLGDWDERGEAAWELREPGVVEAITRATPDLVGLQEVTKRQRAALDSRLPGMRRISFGAPSHGITADGEDPLNTILYRPARFRHEEGGLFWLGLDPTRARKDWEAAFPRCAVWARLIDLDSGAPLIFVSTHLDNDSERARLESTEQILKFLSTRLSEPGPTCGTIIVGDFNSDASQAIHQRFIEGPPPLLDAWEQTHGGPGEPFTDGTFHDFTGKALSEVGRIDWVLFSLPLRPLAAGMIDTGVDGRYPSDHFPVFAAFDRP